VVIGVMAFIEPQFDRALLGSHRALYRFDHLTKFLTLGGPLKEAEVKWLWLERKDTPSRIESGCQDCGGIANVRADIQNVASPKEGWLCASEGRQAVFDIALI
jgi:hypothetical protein